MKVKMVAEYHEGQVDEKTKTTTTVVHPSGTELDLDDDRAKKLLDLRMATPADRKSANYLESKAEELVEAKVPKGQEAEGEKKADDGSNKKPGHRG